MQADVTCYFCGKHPEDDDTLKGWKVTLRKFHGRAAGYVTRCPGCRRSIVPSRRYRKELKAARKPDDAF
jgi:hypothetical protein